MTSTSLVIRRKWLFVGDILVACGLDGGLQ
jgi:hypothetical protein